MRLLHHFTICKEQFGNISIFNNVIFQLWKLIFHKTRQTVEHSQDKYSQAVTHM